MGGPNDIDDLELYPVDSEDGEISYTEEQLEEIRKKTFTDELRSLYAKVSAGNIEVPEVEEPGPVGEDGLHSWSAPADTLDLPRDAVVRQLHDLFYKTVSLEHSSSLTVGFNPFSIHNQDLYHYSVDLLKRECIKLGISQFAVLCFDPKKKAYSPFVMNIRSLDPHNLIISPEEPLYSDILHSKKGVAIDEEAMTKYSYLEKRFPRQFPLEGFAYAVLIQNLAIDLWADREAPVLSELYPGNLYPIFLALVRKGAYTVDQLYSSLKNSISFVLYIINNNAASRPIPSEERTPSFLYSLIDTYGRMYSRIEGTKCYFVVHHAPFGNMGYIAMTYIHSKITSLLGPNSTALHFEKNKIILFLAGDDRQRIEGTIMDTIAVFGDQITVTEIERYSHLDLFKLMTWE